MVAIDNWDMMYAVSGQQCVKRGIMPVYGDRLARRREFLGLSQKDVCHAIGVKSYQQYGHWEAGVHQPPVKYFVPLAAALRTSIDYLFGLTDNPGDTFEEEDMTETEIKMVLLRRAKQYRKAMDLLLSDAPTGYLSPPNLAGDKK